MGLGHNQASIVVLNTHRGPGIRVLGVRERYRSLQRHAYPHHPLLGHISDVSGPSDGLRNVAIVIQYALDAVVENFVQAV